MRLFRRLPMSTGMWVLLTLCTSLSSASAATTYVVYKNTDDGSAGTLRYAIAQANLSSGNTVAFSNTVTGTITLVNGELVLSNSTTLSGPGANVLTISGNNASRVFNVTNGTIDISGLTIANGHTPAYGGGVLLQTGSLTVTACVMTSNNATAGGGLSVHSGSLAMMDSTICGNNVLNNGAGLYQEGGTCILHNCTISSNQCTQTSGSGGGLSLQGGTVFNQLVNCTITANYADYGGGVLIGVGVTLVSCTVSGNSAFVAGGIYSVGSPIIGDTIVAGNSASSPGGTGDCYGAFYSNGFNLIGVGNASTGFGATGDQLGTTNSPINPMLGPLQNNGGPTWTMALLPGSPAIDQGQAQISLTTDQRGRPRPHDIPSVPNNPNGDSSDIGAYEVAPVSLVVSNNNDSGAGSFRQTLADAGGSDGDTITFATNVTGTITLTSGELATGKRLTVSGPGQNALAVNGNGASRVFHVLPGGDVNLGGITITNGYDTNHTYAGAGILNEGTLALDQCAIVGNQGQNNGAGIANLGTLAMEECLVADNTLLPSTAISPGGAGLANSGTLSVYNSTFSQNSLGSISGYGGGIKNLGPAAYIYSSTFYGNGGTSCYGGGLENGTTLTLTNCTISGNQALIGGGIENENLITVRNNIIAGNNAPTGPDCLRAGAGSFTSAGYNLIGNGDGGTGFTNAVNHDLVGRTASPIDPLLGPLQYNGGWTPTMALLSGSPAIDQGNASGFGLDQRFLLRIYDYPAFANASDGADIGAFELMPPPLLTITTPGPNAVTIFCPTNGLGYTFEYSISLNGQSSWTPLSVPWSFNGSQYYIAMPAGGIRFYRLVSPGPYPIGIF